MDRVITHLDQHGRMLIPSNVRERFNIHSGDKVTLEISNDELKIKNVNHLIDEMHNIFTKNQNDTKISLTDDFIKNKREDFKIEIARAKKDE